MLIRVDPNSPQALFEQIAGQIRGAIASGDLAMGTRLAPARELAAVIGVNLHTVLRAYQELSDEGLVEMRRGRGVTVTSDAVHADLASTGRKLIELARNVGLADHQILDLMKGLL